MPRNALYIFSDSSLIETLTDLLKPICYNVISCHADDMLLNNFRIPTPDVILIDVDFPDSSAARLCSQLVKRLSQIPLLILSTYIRIEDIKSCCNSSEFLSKPFMLTELYDTLERLSTL